MLDTRLRALHSLKEIIVNFEKYPEMCHPSGDLTKRIHDIGWIVRVTRVLEEVWDPENIWVSSDNRVEFDNKEERDAYDEQVRIEEEMEKEREGKRWLEENVTYWMNDPDYDY